MRSRYSYAKKLFKKKYMKNQKIINAKRIIKYMKDHEWHNIFRIIMQKI